MGRLTRPRKVKIKLGKRLTHGDCIKIENRIEYLEALTCKTESESRLAKIQAELSELIQILEVSLVITKLAESTAPNSECETWAA